jgi:hypothetical protein
MSTKITGVVYRISPTNAIPSKDGSRQFFKREITLNCTRYDQYTGEKQFENFPTLEFSGDKCKELEMYKPGDVVTVHFELQGVKYLSDGVEKFFTKAKGYKIDMYRKGYETKTEPEQPQEQPKEQPKPGKDGMLFDMPAKPEMPDANDGLPF